MEALRTNVSELKTSLSERDGKITSLESKLKALSRQIKSLQENAASTAPPVVSLMKDTTTAVTTGDEDSLKLQVLEKIRVPDDV